MDSHSTCKFNGKYLPESLNPIIYNVAGTNTFSDSYFNRSQTRYPQVGSHFVPRIEIPQPQAREDVLFAHPWMIQQSDLELKREGKLTKPATDYLYISIESTNSFSGKFWAVANLDSGESITSGGGSGKIDRMGEDLWGRASYTGIPLGSDTLAKIGNPSGPTHGNVFFTTDSPKTELVLRTNPIFFVLQIDSEGNYQKRDITKEFSCKGKRFNMSCRF